MAGYRDLFIVSSALVTSYGLLPTSDRVQQTMNTLQSIRKWAPEADIVVLELSRERIPDEYEQMFLQAGAKMVMHFFNDDGIGTAGLIELDPADDIDFHALFQLKTEVFVDTAPDGSLDDRLFVLEGKILMGRTPPEVGHLTCQVNPLQIGISIKF